MAASASMNAPARPVAITPRAETAAAVFASPELLVLLELDDPELDPEAPEVDTGLAEPVPVLLALAVPLAAAVPSAAAELLAGAALARFATLLHLATAFALISFWLYGK